MKYLKPTMAFHVELYGLSLTIAVKGYKLIKGIVPPMYGDIMNDFLLSDDGTLLDVSTTLAPLSFHDKVFRILMKEKSKFFLEDKLLASKNVFFLIKHDSCDIYHWVKVISWRNDGFYHVGEYPNTSFFVEPGESDFGRKHLLENSIFFVLQPKKGLKQKQLI